MFSHIQRIVTDESAKKEEAEDSVSGDEVQDAANRIAASTNKGNGDGGRYRTMAIDHA